MNVASRAVNAVVFKLIGTAGAVKKNGHFSVHSGGAWCLSRKLIGSSAPDISELGLKYVYNFRPKLPSYFCDNHGSRFDSIFMNVANL